MSEVTRLFSQRLRGLREQRRMTQSELAEMIDVDYQQVGKWETAKHMPNTETLAKLAMALRTSTDYLLNLTDNASERMDNLTDEERRMVDALRMVNMPPRKSGS